LSPFVEFPDLESGIIKRVGHTPKCVPKLCIYGGSGEIFSALFAKDLEGNRNQQAGVAEAEERAAAARMKSSEAVPKQRRDTQQQTLRPSKVVISPLAAGGYRD
jgi:hypothetical protein